ncbi:SHOCT-like domain-containing protein [Aggregatilinea lenta]|uniref:SHOCT-like domain-containing protein n=1 Tax=Aggregatilinea lenta TaxID=913108 RepID=UPI0013C2E01E|nr:hypothetical protein [Aggregatilinea lenta]
MPRIERRNVTATIIVQQVGGDLTVRGRVGSDLTIDGDGVKVEQMGAEQPYLIRCSGDCRMSVPQDVPLVVQQVGGDAKISELGDALDLGAVGGDLVLRSVQTVQLGAVGGDLRLKWVEGDVTIKAIGADAAIREISGSVQIAAVGADLYLHNVEGSCDVDRVGADLVLNMDFSPENEYHFNVEGDILCRVRAEANARFIVPLEMPVELDVEANVFDSEDGEHQIVQIREGRAVIVVEEANEMRLVGETEDYVINLGIQIEEEIEARMSTLEEQLNRQLSGLDERIQAWAGQFAPQAEHYADRAQRQAERALDRFRRNMERQKGKRKRASGTRSFEFSWGSSSGPAAAARPNAEPITEEERLMILRMLQEGKISLDEAERLLAALDAQD